MICGFHVFYHTAHQSGFQHDCASARGTRKGISGRRHENCYRRTCRLLHKQKLYIKKNSDRPWKKPADTNGLSNYGCRYNRIVFVGVDFSNTLCIRIQLFVNQSLLGQRFVSCKRGIFNGSKPKLKESASSTFFLFS